MFPTPGWLAAGAAALESADVVQGHVEPDPSVALGPFDRTLWIQFEVGLYETASLFATREAFDSAGGFEHWLEPEIGKAMAEDVWFGWKARRAGARTAFSGDALAYHAVFPRDWRAYVTERRRLRYFPAMARKMPELRRDFFYRRLFLNRRTAALDAAVVGAVGAAVLRSRAPLIAAAPYAAGGGQAGGPDRRAELERGRGGCGRRRGGDGRAAARQRPLPLATSLSRAGSHGVLPRPDTAGTKQDTYRRGHRPVTRVARGVTR